ncbi:MAG: hypothetical protein PHX18_00975 [Candidatus Gastranaerophilales bacterium]|nr:hypothetical protein [Candidatus Gastranaerophilales bacterium]
MDNSKRLRYKDGNLILDLNTNIGNLLAFQLLFLRIKHAKCDKNLMINTEYLRCLNNSTIKFLQKLKTLTPERTIVFYNLSPVNHCIFNLLELDKCFQLYINEEAALEEMKPIVNRRFKVV